MSKLLLIGILALAFCTPAQAQSPDSPLNPNHLANPSNFFSPANPNGVYYLDEDRSPERGSDVPSGLVVGILLGSLALGLVIGFIALPRFADRKFEREQQERRAA